MPGNRVLLHFLADEALDQIEETAFRLLEEVGLSCGPLGAEMLHGLGCRMEAGRALVPREVVRWGLERITPHTDLYRMDGSRAFSFGDGQIRFHNGGGPPFVYDTETGQRRPALLEDVVEMTRLLDALPNVDVVIPLFGPQDVPAELLVIASTEAILHHTRKPVSSAAADRPAQIPFLVEMAAACCGGIDAFRARPTMSISVSPVSPLTFTEDVVASIVAVAQAGAPFHSLPAPSLGATAPITMAAALAQQHAEVLASFVIAAAAKPGAPVVYCSRINPIDLRTAVSSWGGPEVGMAGAMAGQLAHRLGLPCDAYGLCTSSALVDPQFAYERLANAMTPALAGVDILSGVGGLDSGLSGSLEIAVLDDEMIGLMKQIADGCEVNEETLALDLMRRVIPRDGVFLGERHTVQQMRRGAVWVPTVSERSGSTADGERVGVVRRARERARELLRTWEVEPLPDDTSRHLEDILHRARHELAPH